MAGYADDVTLANLNTCTGRNTEGSDAFFPIELQGGETADITYWQTTYDTSLYVLADCTDTASCITGADMPYLGTPEATGIINNGVTPAIAYIGLDCQAAVGTNACGAYVLGIDIY